MSVPSTLRLDRLDLENYRCFAECQVDFHSDLTVLVADNGFGKTALLDAAALALSTLVDTLAGESKMHGFSRDDVRRAVGEDGQMEPRLPARISARGAIDGKRVKWARTLKSVSSRARTSAADAKPAQRAAAALRERLETYASGGREAPPPLPLVAVYGTGRLWDQDRLTDKRKRSDREPMGRVSGYIDCLSPSSSFKAFRAWYEVMSKAVRDAAVTGHRAADRPELLIAAVRRATSVVLAPTEWSELDWHFAPRNGQGNDIGRGYLVVEHPEHGRLPLSFLSDGVRNMVALVADIAHRCARLNPHFGTEAARMTPGILLIDEVDMHLHPRWQQQVLGLLRKAFPAMQMVVTTHSPQVLSTVDVQCIRVVHHEAGRGRLEAPAFQTLGAESAAAMAHVMGVHGVPQVEASDWLSEYRTLVEAGGDQGPKAQALWDRLVAHFGADHPAVQEVAALRRLQEFKRQHGLTSGEEGR